MTLMAGWCEILRPLGGDHAVRFWAAAVVALLLSACGGGSGGGEPAVGAAAPGLLGGSDAVATGTGQLMVGLTDSTGDFLAYSADVTALTLERPDGVPVNVISSPMRVDFSQYLDMTEFFAAVTVPAGRYTGVRMTLDLRRADVQIEVDSGAVAAALGDVNGAPVSTLEVQTQLSAARPLLIGPTSPGHLTLDFDLRASNDIDTQMSPPRVQVLPLLLADVELDGLKTHRVRGELGQVDRNNGTFTVELRPFETTQGAFGSLKAYTNNTTLFDVNGQAATGTAGLTLLSAQAKGLPLIALGELNRATLRFVVTEVYAGSSVPGVGRDAVSGTVVARRGDVLTVRGATLNRRNGSAQFAEVVSVQMGEQTQVRQQGSGSIVLRPNQISVGQHITALGLLTSDSADNHTLDVRAGIVRRVATNLVGEILSQQDSELRVNLLRLDGRRPALFDFAGTGSADGADADPSNFSVNIGTLNLAGMVPGDRVVVSGFAADFGTAPPAFDAARVVAAKRLADSVIALAWAPPTATPYTTLDAHSIALDVTGVGALHHVRQRGVTTDLLTQGTAPTLKSTVDELGLFAIAQAGSVQSFWKFSEFSAALSQRLDGATTVARLVATGQFDAETTTLTTRRVAVVVTQQ
jgi:hypothetical protein